MNYTPIEKARLILAKAYAPGGAVEEATLDILLDLLSGLLQNCFAKGTSAKDILRLARSNRVLERLGIRFQLIGHVRDYLVSTFGRGAYVRYNGSKMVDTLIDAGKDHDVEESDLHEFMTLRLAA